MSKEQFEHVKHRLEAWAFWAIARQYGGSTTSCMTGMLEMCMGEMIRSTNAGRIPINPDAEEMECIVTRLPGNLKAVIVEQYLHTGSIEAKARRLGCSKRTYYDRLNHAYFRIESEMLDLMDVAKKLAVNA